MKYKVSHLGQEAGEFTLDEILTKVRSKDLELFDYIFDETKGDWILMTDHAGLVEKLRTLKPGRPPGASKPATTPAPTPQAPVRATAPAGDGNEWFVLKGEHRFGPFEFTEVVRMLQQKVVFPFDFVWHSALSDWKRIAEVTEFQPEQIRGLFDKKGKKSEIFVARKHKRKKHATRVIIHDNLSLWKGESFEISQGGVGVTMKNALVVPGQQVFVHVSGGENIPSFNAVCEVVSKKFVNDNSPVEYGLKFISMSAESQDEFNKKVTS